jgi:HAD superfamily hydrolase (TIGR01509 family)
MLEPLGVIFDMDGTLTEPTIDFAAMRADLGLPTGDILAHVEGLSGPARARAEAIIHDHEESAPMTLRPGCLELLEALDAAGLPRAIITRNSSRGVERLLEHLGELGELGAGFSPALDRSFLPPKPEPDSLLHVAHAWGLPIDRLVMVGDSVHDMLAARNARALPILVGSTHTARAAKLAAHHAPHLHDLVPLLGLG